MIDIETRPAPIEVVTPPKASEAMRLGCLAAPVQAFGSLWGNADGAVYGYACAVGAMVLGGFPTSILRRWPGHSLPCPEACVLGGRGTIAHLNDDHGWTRERIADWLEGQGY